MGNRSPFTIPEAWHQTKLALKKSVYMPSRGAEGMQVILEAICEKIGLDLEEVVSAAPVEPKIPETEVVEVTSTPAAEEVPPEPEVDVEVPPPKIEMPEIPPPGKSRRRATKKARKP
tara:strand:- start:205 stop:555 length:351 start_codon:yes stop_codon:yes gene_type:complete